MLIVCPSCATSYDVEAAKVPPDGRHVRCTRCQTVWRAEPSHADQLLMAAAELAPQAETAPPVPDMPADEPVLENDILPGDAGESAAEFDASHSPAADDPAVEADAADIESPPIVPGDADRGAPVADPLEPAATSELEDVESVAARRQPRRRKPSPLRWPLSRGRTVVLALALLDVILIGWRTDVVRALPQTASFYALLRLPVNLRSFVFADVATSMEQHDGVPILVVEGNVINTARKTEDVPRLKFVVRNVAHQEIYSWTAVPARATLASGEALPFSTRLASPPQHAYDLVVRFVARRDVVSGGH